MKKRSILTRNQMMNGECTYYEYMDQFVTKSLIDYVSFHIGRDVIINSTCPHFNDIPLRKWDLLNVLYCIDKNLFSAATGNAFNIKETKFLWSKSDNVCIAKAAARRIRSF